MPLDEGGLGILQLKAWNKSFLIKNLWDLHLQKDLMWVKWTNKRYKLHSYLWTMEKLQVHSPLLKSLLVPVTFLLQALGELHRPRIWVHEDKVIPKVAYNFFRDKGAQLYFMVGCFKKTCRKR